MRYILTILIALFSTGAYAALSDGLPSKIRQALNDAYNTKNLYVIDAVIEKSKEDYPTYAEKIDSYIGDIKNKEKRAAKIAAKKGNTSKISGNIDAALDVANGNTKRQAGNLSSKLQYKSGDFENILKFTARASKEDAIRTDEEYQINNQSRHNFTERDYSFFELEYVNDRFNGYHYRTSELLGYGRKLVSADNYNISSEIGVGARQSSLTDGTDENSLLGKAVIKGDWKINDKITFEQDVSSSFGSDAVITISDSSIKTKVTNSMYLKFNYNFQHIDDVAANTKHIDTLTSIGVGYEF